MRKRFSGFIAFILILLLCSPAAGTAAYWPDQDVLVGRAQGFLELIDRGDIRGAWAEGTLLFMAMKPVDQWLLRQQVLREAYGPLLSRELKLVDKRTTYHLSPDGRYVIVQFRSRFARRAETVETVVLDCQAANACGIREYILR